MTGVDQNLKALADLEAQVDSLPKLLPRGGTPRADRRAKERTKVIQEGGKHTGIVLTKEALAAVNWALATPGMPTTRSAVICRALLELEARHRGQIALQEILPRRHRDILARHAAENPGMSEGRILARALECLERELDADLAQEQQRSKSQA